jgi:uncharacterized membrane protein YhfC
MNILIITHGLNALLMIGLPILLGLYLNRRWRLGWRLWWAGAITFILSQVGHIPFNLLISGFINKSQVVYWSPVTQQIFSACFLGLSAGLFEETARFLVLKLWKKEERSWRKGVVFGAGHGGIEAIFLGVLVSITYVSMIVVKNLDLTAIIPAGQLAGASAQIEAYWSSNWVESLLGAVERLFTIPVQISLAVLVMHAVTRKKIAWFFIAIGYHALLDGVVVFLHPYVGNYWIEVIVACFALISIAIIFKLERLDREVGESTGSAQNMGNSIQ